MRRENLIRRTVNALSILPQDKAKEVADFVDFILQKYDEEILQKGLQQMVSESKTFAFLKDDEDIYSVNDLKERYK